jgi:hypothetical protein
MTTMPRRRQGKYVTPYSPPAESFFRILFSRIFRLFELKGVVVLEKLTEYKEVLQNPGVEETEKIRILDELLEKEPATKIIQTSKIGKVIRNLSKENEGQSERKFFAAAQGLNAGANPTTLSYSACVEKIYNL